MLGLHPFGVPMRTRTLLALCATPLLLWAAADILSELAWNRKAFEDRVFDFVVHEGQLGLPGSASAAKALPASRRAEAARTLCEKAKAFVQSEAFKARYAQYRKDHTPTPPPPMKTLAQLKAEQNKQMGEADKSFQEALEGLKQLPPEMQAKVREGLEAARKAQGSVPKVSDKQLQEAERYRFEASQRDHQEALQRMPPVDPKGLLKKALQNALAATEGIDYGAALTTQYGKKRFTNSAFEQKGDLWKKGFRAGREATEAARTFARTWLAELK